MAVKPEKIKARLKVLFPKANLSQKRIDAIAAKLALKPADDADDAAVDEVINTANDFISFEDIAKEDDRVRTLEGNQKPAPTPTPTPEPTPTPTPTPAPTPGDDPTTVLLRSMAESMKTLTTEVTAMKLGKIMDQKKQTASQAIEASEVFKALKPELKEKWVNRIDLNSETSFEDQVKDFETEFTELKQEMANNTQYAGQAPTTTSNTGKPSDKELDAVIDGL